MKTHELKCWPEFFVAVQNWEKMFEIRHNDRNFKVGDILWLREWSPAISDYTGESVRRVISYITDFRVGLRDGYVCMGLADLAEKEDGCDVSVRHHENCRCPNCIEVSFRINAEHAAKIDTLRKDWESGDYECSFDEFCGWYLKGTLPSKPDNLKVPQLTVLCRYCKQRAAQIWDANGDRWKVAVHFDGDRECAMSDASVVPGGGQIPEAWRMSR